MDDECIETERKLFADGINQFVGTASDSPIPSQAHRWAVGARRRRRLRGRLLPRKNRRRGLVHGAVRDVD